MPHTWARNSLGGARAEAAPPPPPVAAEDAPSKPVLESSSASSTARCSGSAPNTATASPGNKGEQAQ
eukprot:scaffold105451_cov18-Tisochrysis_lutea.AAC.3